MFFLFPNESQFEFFIATPERRTMSYTHPAIAVGKENCSA